MAAALAALCPLAVAEGTSSAILPASGHLDGTCVWVANLHVRKCGGTTVRRVFNDMNPDWTQLGGYCSTNWDRLVRESEQNVTNRGEKKKFWAGPMSFEPADL